MGVPFEEMEEVDAQPATTDRRPNAKTRLEQVVMTDMAVR
jgi:hypothetical protein